MTKSILFIILFLSVLNLKAQSDDYQESFDQIIMEADLLYQYEKVAWNSTDLAMAIPEVKKQFGSFIIYHDDAILYAVFVDQSLKKSIATFKFNKSDLNQPQSKDLQERSLTDEELKFMTIKNKVLSGINKNAATYKLSFPEGYSPNLVMIPNQQGYKFYIIMGTIQNNIIPFGNDWVFDVDATGEISSWKKYHNSLIPSQTNGPNGMIIISFVHSHLKMTPHISPTDICTFRLYGYDLYGLEEFRVLSTALDTSFIYNANSNTIKEVID